MAIIETVHTLPDINLIHIPQQAPHPIRARRPYWWHEAMTVAQIRDGAAATRRGAAEMAATIAAMPDYYEQVVYDDELPKRTPTLAERAKIESALRRERRENALPVQTNRRKLFEYDD